jgi:hypothetical protein
METKEYFRPLTRGDLALALRQGAECEVVASQKEFTSLILSGWFADIQFNVRNSENHGWIIFNAINYTQEWQELTDTTVLPK